MRKFGTLHAGIFWNADAASLKRADLKNFDLLEVPGLLLDDTASRAVLAKRTPQMELWIHSLMPSQLCRAIVDAPQRLRQDFLRETSRKLATAREIGANAVSLRFDWERAEEDKTYCEALQTLLRELYAPLHENKIDLLFPVRIPGHRAPDFFRGVLREAMFPRLALLAELHPHEASFSEESAATELGEIWDLTSALRFCFEPETGNHLTLRNCLKCAGFSVDRMPEIRVIFAPKNPASELLTEELPQWRQLAAALDHALLEKQEDSSC